MKRQVRNMKQIEQTQQKLQLTLVSFPLPHCQYPPHRHPSYSTDLKAFGFSAAALSIKLKFIVDLKWNKYLYSLTGTHTLVHMRCNKDVETQTPLLRSLGIKSLDSLNNPPLLFPSIGTLFICILSFTPAVFPSAPPSLRFLQQQEPHYRKTCKLPILSHHRNAILPLERDRKSIFIFLSELYHPGLSHLMGACHQKAEYNKQLLYFFFLLVRDG